MPRCANGLILALGALALAGSAVALSNGRISGTSRADSLDGTAGNDVIRGRAGKDLIDGKGGSDRLFGDRGNDTVFGGAGSDRLDGGAGNDRLIGGAGHDLLLAGGNAGFFDQLNGGAGNDRLVSGAGGTVHLRGGDGNDMLIGYSSDSRFASDTFSAGAGDDKVLRVDFVLGDGLFLDGCGPGNDLIEVLGVPASARAQMARTLRTRSGCERVKFA